MAQGGQSRGLWDRCTCCGERSEDTASLCSSDLPASIVSTSSSEDRKTEGEEQSSSVATNAVQATAWKTRRDVTGQPTAATSLTEIVVLSEGELPSS